MCVSRTKLDDLCQLFPQTAENIKRKALERRLRFMQQKNLKSARFIRKREEYRERHGDDETAKKELLKRLDKLDPITVQNEGISMNQQPMLPQI